jgi:hypothetical protein
MVVMSGCSGGWEGWKKLRERERGGGRTDFFGGKTRVQCVLSIFFNFLIFFLIFKLMG